MESCVQCMGKTEANIGNWLGKSWIAERLASAEQMCGALQCIQLNLTTKRRGAAAAVRQVNDLSSS